MLDFACSGFSKGVSSRFGKQKTYCQASFWQDKNRLSARVLVSPDIAYHRRREKSTAFSFPQCVVVAAWGLIYLFCPQLLGFTRVFGSAAAAFTIPVKSEVKNFHFSVYSGPIFILKRQSWPVQPQMWCGLSWRNTRVRAFDSLDVKMLNSSWVSAVRWGDAVKSSVVPEMTSSSSMSFSPSLKSSSMFSICVPAFLRWELHHAVNVCIEKRDNSRSVLHRHTR